MTIAVAYRPDEFGRAALDWAVEQSKTSGDRIVLINISRVEPRLDTGFARGNHVQSLAERLDADKVEYEIRQAVGENVADAVLFEAEQAGATSIVIGIRRRSPVGKILMGSVAQQILLDASVPVVAVKP
ncbi:universal stress protein [Aeromicrobium sp. SMF47]|uniref:Universal stress protein n=1 Tax=Aeromicrobium yanjiei TaxID=2662028 RepID=A0A5Q2MIW5_9ACTN|nr:MULTISPECIES: universal stress protein [Aeromicrobium]MRJ77223.1 universal stress protein [Aeromicrobium yanjiei]MRK01590.1 universal stress protein [Aeromicrobium sp. S22]QGG41643.1 universal stress protein [Aeromicrobium yanjiei]